MTDEQALETLRKSIDPLCDATDEDALDRAFNALKKQIPMRPTAKHNCDIDRSSTSPRLCCGNCGGTVYINEPYCHSCGQALKWRDD